MDLRKDIKEMKVNWATSPGNQPKQDTSSEYAHSFQIFVFTRKIFLAPCVLPLILYLLDLLDSHTNWSEQRITLKENFLKLFRRKL
ncbi:hypothetical protein DBV15_06725 [Temnothorax longispinosus]|uniref:Uncharacterized protein n=1 Tax=Temnothorax longispinosus TaxID=300112 RepID=A0A4S2JSH3_9HYME|nr:hypothetical protein DBV15_06725 [Temnothorax longispinosus]